MGKFAQLGHDLYTGEKSIDFVGKRKIWYATSLLIVIVAASGLWFRGLDYGIEFVGGSEFRVTLPADEVTQETADDLRAVIADSGVEGTSQPSAVTSGKSAILIQTEQLGSADRKEISDLIVAETSIDPETDLSINEIGASWGRDVAVKSLWGLGVFLVVVTFFIRFYSKQWKMSIAALVALAHDVLITVGVYAWSAFEVTPATITGLLTILGFSLYDTVVVFDKVKENTDNLLRTHQTYSEAANLAVNQTLVRSINTSIVALLPVGAILWVGVTQLGSSSLKDLALALFVGMAAGAYSSIFIATPLLAQLKEREATSKLAAARAKSRRKTADRYANVGSLATAERTSSEMDAPSLTGQAPVVPRTAAATTAAAASGEAEQPRRRPPGRPAQPTLERRTPPPAAPIEESQSAGRKQPARKPRSQRGKK